MSIQLSKGGNVNLSKEVKGLDKILVGLGWEERKTSGKDFDLDASAFLLDSSGKCKEEKNFVFYNNKVSLCESVKHQGDNLTGKGDGDDEKLIVELSKVPTNKEKITFVVSIHEAKERKQNFGQIEKAFIRIVDLKTNQEITRFDLSEDFSNETSMIFGELYRAGDEWKFKAIAQGFTGGLEQLLPLYGLE